MHPGPVRRAARRAVPEEPAVPEDQAGHLQAPTDAGVVTRAPRRLPRWVRPLLSLVLIAAAVWLLRREMPDSTRSMATLRDLSVPLLVVALGLEALSLACYSAVTAAVFASARIDFGTLLRIDLVTTGLSHAVPAGGATAAAVRLRMLHRSGIRRSETLAGAAVQATACNLVLGGIFLLGVGMWIFTGGTIGQYAVASGIVAFLIALVLALGWLTARRGDQVTAWATALLTRIRPAVRRMATGGLLPAVVRRVTFLADHPSRTGRVLAFAALNWLLDAAVLWLMLAAAGSYLAPGPLLVVYGLGNLLAVVPLTPGGLGIVEGSMIPSLIGFGVARAPALIGVLGWRLWQFWLPIPVAAACYLSLVISWRRREQAQAAAGGAHSEER